MRKKVSKLYIESKGQSGGLGRLAASYIKLLLLASRDISICEDASRTWSTSDLRRLIAVVIALELLADILDIDSASIRNSCRVPKVGIDAHENLAILCKDAINHDMTLELIVAIAAGSV